MFFERLMTSNLFYPYRLASYITIQRTLMAATQQ
jgi:hypothetical protein